jgi:hypothetical protein
MPPLTPHATPPILQLILLVHSQMSPPTQDKMLEPNLYQHNLTMPKVVSVNA